MLTDPYCPDCYGSGVIVHAEGDVVWSYCHCATGVVDDDLNQSIVNRDLAYTIFIPVNACRMCGGSLVDNGLVKCVCKVSAP